MPLVQRDITWAPGLRWRQQFVNLGTERFPVVWLEINPRKFGLTLKPIWANPRHTNGYSPLNSNSTTLLSSSCN